MSTNVDRVKMNIQIICMLLLRKIYHHSKNLMLITDKTGFSCHILKAQVVKLLLVLSHGQPDINCDVSINNSLIENLLQESLIS